jgi:hypothetical protein
MENQPDPIPQSEPTATQPGRHLPVAAIAALAVVVLAGGTLVVAKVAKKLGKQAASVLSSPSPTAISAPAASPDIAPSSQTKISVLEEGKLILTGGYADPTVVPTATGYRMYVNRQSNGPGGYLTYVSPDGIAWTKEKDIIISGVATGRAVVLPTGIRFYYPGVQPIKPTDAQADMYSSFSTDGVTFTKDAGTVLKPRSSAHYVEGPTVFQLPDKTWRMYFNENTVAAANQRDGEIWGASSADGLTWTRDAALTMQADSVEATVEGKRAPWKQVLHPFVVSNPKGGYIMLYNSHSAIFAATSADGLAWDKIGPVGIHGADIDGYFQADGTMRIYYGDFSPADGGMVYMGVLKVQ